MNLHTLCVTVAQAASSVPKKLFDLLNFMVCDWDGLDMVSFIPLVFSSVLYPKSTPYNDATGQKAAQFVFFFPPQKFGW